MRLHDITPETVSVSEIPELAALSNDRQRNFAIFYVSNGGNGAAAARDAGYTAKTSNRNGGTYAKSPKIKAAIEAIRNWFFAKHTMSKQEALAILSMHARSSLGDVLDDNGNIKGRMVKEAGAVVKSYKVKKSVDKDGNEEFSRALEMRDPRSAIETIAKIEGWFREEIKVNVGNIQFVQNLGGGK